MKMIMIAVTGILIGASITTAAPQSQKYIQPQSLDIVWEENFDSYDLGSAMHGQGGWQGWDNNPDATGYVSDLYAQTSPHSVEIAYYEGTAADLVHQFTGVSSGQWTFTTYQYIPNDFTGKTNFLLLNTYNDGGPYHWSNAVSFNSDTGNVESWEEEFLPIEFDEWIEIRVEIDFSTDWQEIYYDGSLLVAKSWTEGIEPGGVLNLACVDLFAGDIESTEVYYDDFTLEGVATDADLDCDGDLAFGEVNTDEELTATITVENIGAPGTELSWEISDYPTWGEWSFDPESGTGLTPEAGPLTIDVTVIAPSDKDTNFTGTVVLTNTDNPGDTCTIVVSLATPQSTTYQYPILQRILERFPLLELFFHLCYKN